MALLTDAINPPGVLDAIADGRLKPAASPVIPGGKSMPPPDAPGIGRNPFLICSHPLVPTVDGLRQFYRQSVPQFRLNLFNS